VASGGPQRRPALSVPSPQGVAASVPPAPPHSTAPSAASEAASRQSGPLHADASSYPSAGSASGPEALHSTRAAAAEVESGSVSGSTVEGASGPGSLHSEGRSGAAEGATGPGPLHSEGRSGAAGGAPEPGSLPPTAPSAPAAEVASGDGRPGAFEVRLSNFEGPFDLLLTLISKHQLDVTEVALSQVTDEFIAYIRALGSSWDLGQATEFLVVAATLLDLKAARLLPSAEVEDEEDLALLEARDLLFARLLQYRAYKQAAAHLRERERDQSRRFPRAVALEPRFAELMPELLLTISPDQLARIAAEALRPKPPPIVSIAHVHAPRVSVREHAMILRERLSRTGRSTFRGLTQDCEHTVELVARFLALLELYREGAVAFDQVAPLGELWVRWTGAVGPEEPVEDENMDEEYG
jgi:segregation and condensation protein A